MEARAWAGWYAKVPRLFGGSDAKSVEHLQRSLAYAPDNITSHFFLAETYLDMNRRDDARRSWNVCSQRPFRPDWIPEEREFKKQARRAWCSGDASAPGAQCAPGYRPASGPRRAIDEIENLARYARVDGPDRQ
jgi:hypothetical protein